MDDQSQRSDSKSGARNSLRSHWIQPIIAYANSSGAWIKRTVIPGSDRAASNIVLRLTAIILLLRPMGPLAVRPLILVLAGLALAIPRVLRAPATWYALGALVGVRIIADWPLSDNHIYLLAYWCLALGLALGARDAPAVMRQSSRWLIGLAFLMAVLWKGVLSHDYLDGRFFSVTLRTDGRFAGAARLVGGLTAQQLEESRLYLSPLPAGAELQDPLSLAEPLPFKVLHVVDIRCAGAGGAGGSCLPRATSRTRRDPGASAVAVVLPCDVCVRSGGGFRVVAPCHGISIV
jgi:hypothetical protein